jgi:hypothetical protein
MPRLRPQELRATPREAQEQDEKDDVTFVSIRDVLIGQSAFFCNFGSHFDGHRYATRGGNLHQKEQKRPKSKKYVKGQIVHKLE